jgi:hypothetical protein
MLVSTFQDHRATRAASIAKRSWSFPQTDGLIGMSTTALILKDVIEMHIEYRLH